MLAGKKTYLVGISMLLYAWGGYAGGIHTMETAVQMTLNALGIMGLRSGIAAVK